MAKFVFRSDFKAGVNIDLDESRLPPDMAVFLKNVTRNVNINAAAASLSGSNKNVFSPLEGNVALTISGMPSGANYGIGFYSSEQTNEGYYFLYNSNNNHSIWVINGDTGVVSKVYQGALLGFQLDPQYFISPGRCTLELRSRIDPVSGKETNFKFQIFAYNFNNQFLIEVNSSIATASFSTSFFTASSSFYNPLELIHLGVPTPLQAIGLNTPTAYSPVGSDLTVQNLLVRNGWQFRVKFIDIFGRESEHGIISEQYITIVGGGCISASNGLPRCLMLNFSAGNPLVNQIQVEYRKWVGNDKSGALATNWNIYETFNKYSNNAAVQWYARAYNPLFTTAGSGVTFDLSTNTIAYTFCADKGSIPISTTETSRTEPELARTSSSVFSVNKRIGLANNVRGFQPVPQDIVNKVVFSAKLPASSPCPAAPLRKITVYASIYDPVATLAGEHRGIVRTSFGKIVWGNADGPCGSYSSYSVDQVFGDQTPGNSGFIGCLRGTNHKCIAQQGDFDPATGNFVYQGYGAGISFPHGPVQQFTFVDVPAGKYIMQIASHKAKISDLDCQLTSTYVGGLSVVSDLSTSTGMNSFASNPIKEVVIDCTAGDVNLNQPTDPVFVILDTSIKATDGSAVIDGYLYETAGGDTPIEMNPVYFRGTSGMGTGVDCFGSFFTDHNGFFFGVTDAFDLFLYIYADICDGSGVTQRSIYNNAGVVYPYIHEGSGGISHGDGTGTPAGACYGVHGDWKNRIYLFPSTGAYPAAARRTIKQHIADCTNHTLGLPGVPIVMTKCGFAITDSSGNASILAHNRYNYAASIGSNPLPWFGSSIPNFSTSPNNQDKFIYSQKGGCEWTDCGGCNSYRADVTINYLACGVGASGCPGGTPDRTTCLADIYVQFSGVNIKGVQSGGKYKAAFLLHDIIGRKTAPQVRQGNAGFVSIPNLNDINSPYPTMALSQIQCVIDPAVVFDPIFTKMTVAISSNIPFVDFFSWPADWVQKIDNTGLTNPINPTAIRVYYNSLNEYSKSNDFATNTGWELITTGGSTKFSPVEGDIVQFIMNGDGTYFPSVIAAPVTYDKSGTFFTIEYLPELATLTNGALFRIIRPNSDQSGDNVPLYEQSFTIPLVAGVPSILSFTVPYFDSYLLGRQIPVPIMKGQPGPVAPGGVPVLPIQYTSSNQDATLDVSGYSENNINNANGVVIFSLTDSPTSFPFFFESPSPADTWGSHLACRGRVVFQNPFEQQQRIGTEIALSDALGDRGILNGLSYFESQNAVVFDRNAWGNITVVLVETSVCMVICNSDHFLTRYNSTQLRVDTQGNVIGQNPYGFFTAPERKQGQNFGCIPINVSSIDKYAGTVVWIDAKGHLVFSNFGDALPMEQAGYQGYLLNKIALNNIRNLTPNSNGITYWHGKIDPKTLEYILTSFNIPASGAPSYINTDTQPHLVSNETLIFDLTTGILKGFASFTPEYYGVIPGYFLQKNFLSFKNGVPYIHHNNFANNVAPPPYAKFYGTQCECRITLVCNSGMGESAVGPEKVKRFFYVEFYSREALLTGSVGVMPQPVFFADTITTEKNQLSRLKPLRFVFKDGYWCSEFLNDLNTAPDPNISLQTGAHKILDGSPLQGRWIKASFVTQGSYAGSYFEISAVALYGNSIEKSL